MNVATPLAQCKGKIVFLKNEDTPTNRFLRDCRGGGQAVVIVRLEGFALLRNGVFKIAGTWKPSKPAEALQTALQDG
jgi:hypothetical protein